MPELALFGVAVCMVTMIYYNRLMFDIFAASPALGYAYFLMTGSRRDQLVVNAA